MPQTLLGFDFGRIRIGVAVGNTVTDTARALAIVDSEPLDERWKSIATLIEQWRPDVLVVGRPVPSSAEATGSQLSSGATGPPAVDESNVHETAARCERFARQLAGRFRLPVALVDESGSSMEAAAALAARRRMRVDGPAGADAHAAAKSGRRRKRTTQSEADDAEAAAIILRQYLSRL